MGYKDKLSFICMKTDPAADIDAQKETKSSKDTEYKVGGKEYFESLILI